VFAVGPIQSVKQPSTCNAGQQTLPYGPGHRKPNGLSQVPVPARLFVEISFGKTIASLAYVIRVSIERAGGTAGAPQFVRIAK